MNLSDFAPLLALPMALMVIGPLYYIIEKRHREEKKKKAKEN